ncbi:MAG: hypothetical protein EOP84_17875 [Verrucomicrobiaceae bacterium]|nr:MAG: hypothetical protein EOP84_17875 [Verrucomicrobiaceae bacterium]
MSGIPEHLKVVHRRIDTAPNGQVPEPWRRAGVFAIGGLTDVGFADDTDLLLVLSSQGRGIYDCTTGERVERDRSEDFPHDPANLIAPGFGILEGVSVRTAGMYGGGLCRVTADGWSVECVTLHWPEEILLLVEPWHSIYADPARGKAEFHRLATEHEVRAFGFSPTGRSLVIATSSDVTVFTRG